ncbi:MAG: NAD(P)-binding protein [Planctomycetota bacterium]
MDRSISRRDFLNGVGVAVTGSLLGSSLDEANGVFGILGAAFAPEKESGYYPPALTGMRGCHEGSYETAHQLRDGKSWDHLGPEAETGEQYDLVIVGGGLSGLSAAYSFRKEMDPRTRILVLDNHDDFGGQATRNEFRRKGKLLLIYGGTVEIEDLSLYSDAAKAMIRELGIQVDRYDEFVDRELYRSLNLRRGVFFDKETFGTDRLVLTSPNLKEFLAKTPLSEQARKDIVRLYEDRIDYLPDLSVQEKTTRLQKMSYRDFLTDVVKVHEQAIPYLQTRSHSYWAIGIDALPAWVAWKSGYPGLRGMNLPRDKSRSGQYFRFPDGNASIARLLVREMIPKVAQGSTMEDIVTARFDYAQLDQESAPVRIRLNSTAVRVRHLGDPQTAKEVEVTYVRGGKAQRVRAGNCILACDNAIIPYLCREIPERQKKALSYALKAPLVYTSVLIRNWKPFEKLRLRSARCPGSYHSSVSLNSTISLGGYQCSSSPREPMILHLTRVPLSPGLSAPEQFKAGQRELLTTTFETFERKTRDQLSRLLAAGGFDPAQDIEAITVNRWPHGYAYGYDPVEGDVAFEFEHWPEAKRTWLVGRERFGRISIANSDAGSNAMTEAAIGEAHRAVQEIVGDGN